MPETSSSSSYDVLDAQTSTNAHHTPQGLPTTRFYNARLSIGGMTCASCVNTITDAVSGMDGVSEISVSLMAMSATVLVREAKLADAVVERIEDIGYECRLVSLEPVAQHNAQTRPGKKRPQGKRQSKHRYEVDDQQPPRVVSLRVNGMFCPKCPGEVMAALSQFSSRVTILKPVTSQNDPIIRLSYTPSFPDFTIRTIIAAISNAKSPSFSVSIVHPPSPEELAQLMQKKEQTTLLMRLAVSVACAIPTFIIGIVYMSLLPRSSPGREYFEEHVWSGQVSRGEWVMLILSTPVMFYSAWGFHERAIKEIISLWRPGSPTPIIRRFTRFGSMNLLVSLGVAIAYISSLVSLGIAATRRDAVDSSSTSYFDSVVFLTMFLLIGRYLEAFSKNKAASSISLLGKLRPTEALVVVPRSQGKDAIYADNIDTMEKGSRLSTDTAPFSDKYEVEKIHVDLLEVGDIVRVQPGSTPPADGTIVSDETTFFDESSLTGESQPVKKEAGDQVFVGTINKLRMVEVRVDAIGGETMLDKIVTVVREGSSKRAPIERIADVLTGYFVPVVTLLAICTWLIWLGLGLGGALPKDLLANSIGGWPIWSLEFAIAVFVIACPCGIGLAAPTAILVGSGLAAKFGILARGGGEAFQEAAELDLIVFDKTGTLTEGGEPVVTDELLLSLPGDSERKTENGFSHRRAQILKIAALLESTSSHTLALAMENYCKGIDGVDIKGSGIEETPGRGIKGTFLDLRSSAEFDAIVGNEAWMTEHGASLGEASTSVLARWKSEGKSVVLLAIHLNNPAEKPGEGGVEDAIPLGMFTIVAGFAIADPVRKEARDVVARLQEQGIGTWMISGDNEITARAVAKTVGIPECNVIAGVLPQQKAEHVLNLQRTGKKRERASMFGKKSNDRCIVAMVGDGINDAPALTTADVGIAMGSGSDIAISSAKFILVTANLQTLLTLTDLSRKVLNRVKFNFLWAVVYNLVAVPLAAGVIFPAGHARLGPVWSSLAMALSSTSVVCSSLLLKLYKQPKTSTA